MFARPRTWHPAAVPVLALTVGGVLALAVAGPVSSLDLAIPLLWAAGWLVILTLATFGVGDLLLPVRSDGDRLEQLVLALVAGAGALVAAAGLLGAFRLFLAPLLLSLLGLAACRGGLRASRLRWPPPPPVSSPALAVLLALVGIVALLAATAPSPFYDQWNYHLAMPFHWLERGSLVVFPRQVYTFLPANASLLFAYGLAGPGPWAAQVTTWWCVAMAAAAAAALARSVAPGRPSAPWLAATVLVCTPTVCEMATLALADPVVMMFGGAAWLAGRRLVMGERAWSVRQGAVMGAFLSLAVGTKYLAGLTVAVPIAVGTGVAAWIAVRSGAATRKVWVSLSMCVMVSALVFLPWAVRNTAMAGAPLYPYFSEGQPETEARALGVSRLGFDVSHLRVVASVGSVGTQGHAARVGPVYLWLVPIILVDVVRRRGSSEGPGILLLACGALSGLVGFTLVPSYGRFLAPVLVVLAALGGAAWAEQIGRVSRGFRAAATAALLVVLVGGLNPVRMSYVLPQLSVATGGLSAERLLAQGVSSWSAMRAANSMLPSDAVLLLVAETRSFGFEHTVIVEDPFGVPLLVELAEQSSSAADLLDRLRSQGITHVVANWREAERLVGGGDPGSFLQTADSRSQEVLAEAMAAMTPIWENSAVQILALPVTDRATSGGRPASS